MTSDQQQVYRVARTTPKGRGHGKYEEGLLTTNKLATNARQSTTASGSAHAHYEINLRLYPDKANLTSWLNR